MTTITTTNPYLLGNFAPVSTEIQAENLKVIGEIPTELRGMFVRNGPNPQNFNFYLNPISNNKIRQ